MGYMLRSDPMTMCDIYLQPEVAFEVLSHLGEMGCVQFIDMNSEVQAFQKNYITEVRRFAEMERKLRFMEKEIKKNNIPLREPIGESKAVPLQEMEHFESMLEKWEQDIQEMIRNELTLMKSYLELTEFFYVLTSMGPLLGDAEIKRGSKLSKKDIAGLVITTGVVQRAKSNTFEMMLWRVSRGIIYYRQASNDKILIDPKSHKEIRKVAFLAVCQGKALAARVQMICSGFQVNTYPCPNTHKERTELMNKLETRISDLNEVLEKTRILHCKSLVSLSKQWRLWMSQVKKAKAIYHTLNMFNLDVTRKCLIGQCWVPDRDLDSVKETLLLCSMTLQSTVPSFLLRVNTSKIHPTYHRTNKFTKGFQELINTYGCSTYRELNPGLYTLVTFPFLFAIMFGDIGHGFFLCAFAGWMLKNEEKFSKMKSSNEIWNILFSGRYVILMMGVGSIFVGFLYNECFAKAFALRKSYWMNTFSVEDLRTSKIFELDPADATYAPYPYGRDPIWALAKNRIIHDNSLKMKLALIIGVVHMIFGIILSFFNFCYFRRYYYIFLQFLPKLLFFTLLFFWLVVMIYVKWFKYNAKTPDPEKNSHCAPQILVLFIDMILLSESKPVCDDCDEVYMFPGQRMVQTWLVLISTLCVPVLFLGTPIYKLKYNVAKRKHAEIKYLAYQKAKTLDSNIEDAIMAQIHKYSASFGELLLTQGVHTMEFLLSTVSHTASYLRLWALSLAHEQLSNILWEMVLSKLALKDYSLFGSIRLFVIFALWAALTICVLVVMEGLSAFLHCLRLHWIEFMSKFYCGRGYPFRPFSFEDILAADVDNTAP